MLIYKNTDNKYKNIKEIAKEYFKISDRLLIKLKKNNRIFLNNTSVYITSEININDIISFDINFDEESENIVSKNIPLDIIFEDENMLIVNKPSGIPVHPSILHYENSLSNGIKFYFDKINLKRKIRPVNRLDKDTSGIVIFAKNEYIQECLIKQMKSNQFVKEYLGIVDGYLNQISGTIDAPIARKEGSIIEREININGDHSVTHFVVIKQFEIFSSNINSNIKLSLVKFKLETGRTHQIRVHTKYIGHPLIGDSLYGKESCLISRQALHSYKVSFIHPIKKENLVFEIELPNDMKKILN